MMNRILATLLVLISLCNPLLGYAGQLYRGDVVGGVGGIGDVVGPSVSVDNGIVRYDGTTGKLIQSYTSNTPTCDDTGICTFVAPVLGVASATSINGNTLTTGTGTLSLNNATLNVDTTGLATDNILRYNGTSWVPGTPATSSAGPGIEFYNATPAIEVDDADNDVPISTLSKTPIVTAEQTITGTGDGASTAIAFGAWLYDTALGRTTINAGVWQFETYVAINVAGGTTTLTRQVYAVVPVVTGTVTVTGTGTSRTATASAGTPFNTTDVTGSATSTTASYLQTPKGLYQITARTSDTVVTILTPTGYTNDAAASFNVWRKLVTSTTDDINDLGTNYTLHTFGVISGSFTVTALTKLGAISFVSSSASRTITLSYNGTARNTHFSTPLVTMHNNLAGLDGGTAGQFFHLTTAQHLANVTNFTVAGPTVPRIMTFPDAATTVLTTNAAVTVAQGGTGLATLTDKNVILGAGTATPTFVAPSTSGNVLTSNGTTWTSAASAVGAVATDAIWDAKGDIVAATGANASVRVAVGTNTHVLTADSTQASGVKWAAPPTDPLRLQVYCSPGQAGAGFPFTSADTTVRYAPIGPAFNRFADSCGTGIGVAPAIGGLQSATETTAGQWAAQRSSGTAKNFSCVLQTAPGTVSDAFVFTVRKNEADTALTCTITTTEKSCADTSNTFAVTAGDRLNLKIEGVSTPVTSNAGGCGFEIHY